jgi:hypothetical protein
MASEGASSKWLGFAFHKFDNSMKESEGIQKIEYQEPTDF